MADVSTPQSDSAGQQAGVSGWNPTRLGVLAPLGVIVAIAIVCIVVAALLSAHRADDVALDRERQLLARAISTQGDWIFGRVKNLIDSTASVSAEDIEQSSALVQQRLTTWLGALSDHNLVLVLNSQNEIAYAQRGRDDSDVRLSKAVFGRLQMLADSIRGGEPAMPAGIRRLHERPDGSVHLVNIDGELAIAAAMPVGNPGSEHSQLATAPMIMALRVVGPRTLATPRLSIRRPQILEAAKLFEQVLIGLHSVP